MNQELKNLQQKYAINLFDWFDLKSNKSNKEEDSIILVLGDVDENFIFPLAKRVAKLVLVLETKEMEKALK